MGFTGSGFASWALGHILRCRSFGPGGSTQCNKQIRGSLVFRDVCANKPYRTRGRTTHQLLSP